MSPSSASRLLPSPRGASPEDSESDSESDAYPLSAGGCLMVVDAHLKTVGDLDTEIKGGAASWSGDGPAYGINELPAEEVLTFWAMFKDGMFGEQVSRQILYATVWSIGMDAWKKGITRSQMLGEMGSSSMMGWTAVYSAYVGAVADEKLQAARLLAEASRPRRTVQLLRNGAAFADGTISGTWEEVDVRTLCVGDVIQLDANSGEVAADVRVIWSDNFRAIEAWLTGEGKHIPKHAGQLGAEDAQHVHRHFNMILAGSVASSGLANGIVVAVGEQTRCGEH